jgi:hypothetical protein
MNIDFSPLKDLMNQMAFELAIILFIPLIAGLIFKWILRAIKIPNILANYGAILVLLFVFYQTIIIVLD